MIKSTAKKIISLLLSVAILASIGALSGCAVNPKPVMKINTIDIGNDVLTYFLDMAETELGKDAEFDDILSRAEALTQTYFKTNSLAHKEGISLSTAEKAAVSKKVGAYWSFYGEYFSKIGISKETLTKIFTAESYRKALLMFYYGKGGSEELPESSIYAYFRVNYVVFQAINGYFTYLDEAGNSVRLTDNEVEAIILKFQNMASMINAGERSMDEAADILAAAGYSGSVSTVVLKKNDTATYPAGFFEKVQTTEPRIATVIGTSNYIFIVVKGSVDTSSSYYNDKREEIITDLVGNGIDTIIESSLKTDFETVESEANGLFYMIKTEKGL